MVINWGSIVSQIIIVGLIAVAAGAWKLYKAVWHKKPIQNDWPEDEVTGRVSIPPYMTEGRPQSIQGCRDKVKDIKKDLNDSFARTSAEISNMRKGIYKKLDSVSTNVHSLKLEMEKGMFQAKESARKIVDETLEKHEKRYKHGLHQ